jgi:uncharacterized membrane protein
LQGYENIEPGLAGRIVKMAEEQAKHRQSMEKKALAASIGHDKIGMYAGVALTLVAMLIGGVLIALDKDVAGWVTLLGTLGFQGLNYIWQRKQEAAEDRKDEEGQEPGAK